MKYPLLLAVAISLLVYSCKKQENNNDNFWLSLSDGNATNVVPPTVCFRVQNCNGTDSIFLYSKQANGGYEFVGKMSACDSSLCMSKIRYGMEYKAVLKGDNHSDSLTFNTVSNIPGIFGSYRVVKSSYWSSGPSGGTTIIDSNRLVSVVEFDRGVIRFVDGTSSYELRSDKVYCTNLNCYSGDFFTPGWELGVCTFYPGSSKVYFKLTSPYASGSSGVIWEGYKTP